MALELFSTSDHDLHDIVSFTACIGCCAKGAQWLQALQLLRDAVEIRDGQLDAILYNATMNALQKAGKWQHALRLLEEMRALSMSSTLASHTSLISSFEKSAQWEWALQQFSEVAGQFSPNLVVFNSTISAMAAGAQWSLAATLLELVQNHWTPDSLTYNSVLSSLQKSKQWQLALQLSMLHDLRLDLPGYHALVDSLETAHRPEVSVSVSWRAGGSHSALRLEDFEAPSDSLESKESKEWGFENFGTGVMKLFEKAFSESTDPRPFQQLQNVRHLTEASSWRFKRRRY